MMGVDCHEVLGVSSTVIIQLTAAQIQRLGLGNNLITINLIFIFPITFLSDLIE